MFTSRLAARRARRVSARCPAARLPAALPAGSYCSLSGRLAAPAEVAAVARERRAREQGLQFSRAPPSPPPSGSVPIIDLIYPDTSGSDAPGRAVNVRERLERGGLPRGRMADLAARPMKISEEAMQDAQVCPIAERVAVAPRRHSAQSGAKASGALGREAEQRETKVCMRHL